MCVSSGIAAEFTFQSTATMHFLCTVEVAGEKLTLTQPQQIKKLAEEEMCREALANERVMANLVLGHNLEAAG